MFKVSSFVIGEKLDDAGPKPSTIQANLSRYQVLTLTVPAYTQRLYLSAGDVYDNLGLEIVGCPAVRCSAQGQARGSSP
jgi:hypothetical protein